jgi:hypothetical protein
LHLKPLIKPNLLPAINPFIPSTKKHKQEVWTNMPISLVHYPVLAFTSTMAIGMIPSPLLTLSKTWTDSAWYKTLPSLLCLMLRKNSMLASQGLLYKAVENLLSGPSKVLDSKHRSIKEKLFMSYFGRC